MNKKIISGISLIFIGLLITIVEIVSMNLQYQRAIIDGQGWYDSTIYLIIIVLGVIICIIGFIIILLSLFSSDNNSEIEKYNSSEKSNENSALNTLKIRYAKGEISKEEFEQMKRAIEGTNE